MCVCMYAWQLQPELARVCTDTETLAQTQTATQTHAHASKHACMHARTHTHTHIHTHTHSHTRTESTAKVMGPHSRPSSRKPISTAALLHCPRHMWGINPFLPWLPLLAPWALASKDVLGPRASMPWLAIRAPAALAFCEPAPITLDTDCSAQISHVCVCVCVSVCVQMCVCVCAAGRGGSRHMQQDTPGRLSPGIRGGASGGAIASPPLLPALAGPRSCTWCIVRAYQCV